MADIFISFADEEKRLALALKRLLEEQLDRPSIFVSADDWQLLAGERWLDRIEVELRSAKAVVLLLSPRSIVRPWINFEAGAAWLKGACLIPVCFGGLSLAALPKPYGDLQGIQLENRGHLYLLMRSVSQAIGEILAPPPLVYNSPHLPEFQEALTELAERQP